MKFAKVCEEKQPLMTYYLDLREILVILSYIFDWVPPSPPIANNTENIHLYNLVTSTVYFFRHLDQLAKKYLLCFFQ